ncbi:MAG: hypothetical protein IJQ10_00555 [Clostridia bacterium]|nr:hypothetical protein [Clostridia bacterium]
MKVSKLLVSSLLCGTLLTSPAAKANLLADIGKYFLIGTGIYVSYRAVKAAAEATGNGEFQSAVDKVGGAATDACDAVVKFGATVAESAGSAAARGVKELADAIKGKKNLGVVTAEKNDLNINNEDKNQIISDTPGNN